MLRLKQRDSTSGIRANPYAARASDCAYRSRRSAAICADRCARLGLAVPAGCASAPLHRQPTPVSSEEHWTSACVQPPQYMKTVKVEMGRAYFEHTNPEELVLKEGITQAERPVSEWAQPTAA